MEKQRQIEWENQQLQKMQQSRQQEQEKLLKLKAQNQTYATRIDNVNLKIISPIIMSILSIIVQLITFIAHFHSFLFDYS